MGHSAELLQRNAVINVLAAHHANRMNHKRVAARLRPKAEAVETIIEHITSGHMVQLQDGTDVNHRIIDTKDPQELRNLALWILSL